MTSKPNSQIEFNWKQKIKYLQILFFLILLVGYFVYGWFMQQKQIYDNKKSELDKKVSQLASLQSKLIETENFISNLQDIQKNFKAFAGSFNNCYIYYEKRGYSLYTGGVSLRNCMYEAWYKKPYLKTISDDKIVKIAQSFGILKLDNSKLSFPETKILSSLDKNMFSDELESKVDFVTFGRPSLVAKNFNLYSVSFSFKTKANYSEFKNLFKKLQNKLYEKNYVFYDINSISSFDITSSDYQDLLVQGKIYFQK